MFLFGRLDLIAFGNFEGTSLDLSDPLAGFHLFSGRNERGKSTARRGTADVTFGIPVRTGDGHRHGYEQMRIGALLTDGKGSELYVVRRKGRKNTLCDGDGHVLDESVLDPYLGGITRELFEAMFSISYDSLEQGGKDLLAGRGRVGESLFAAGGGLAGLRHVLGDLEDEAGALFKARRGTQCAVQDALRAYKDERAQIREAELRPKEWEERQTRLVQLRNTAERVGQDLADRTGERAHLERLRETIPLLVQRNELVSEHDALGELPRLASDADKQREDALRDLRDAKRREQRAEETLEPLAEVLDGFDTPSALLDRGPAIKELHSRVTQFRDSGKDVVRRRAELAEKEERAISLLRELRPELSLAEVEKLRLTVAARSGLREAFEDHPVLEERVRQTEESAEQVEADLGNEREELADLPPIPDAAQLRASIEASGNLTELAEEIDGKDTECRRTRRELVHRIAALRPAVEDAEDLGALTMPAAETIERFVEGFAALDEEKRGLADERRTLGENVTRLEEEREGLRLRGQAPTIEELEEVRAERGTGWGLARDRLEGRADPEAEREFAGESALVDAVDATIERADEIADRRAIEAEQVAKQDNLLAREHGLAGDRKRLDAWEEDLAGRRTALFAEWERAWVDSGLAPLPPKEMQGFASGREALLSAFAELERQEGRLGTLRERLSQRAALLREALVGVGVEAETESTAALKAKAVATLRSLEEGEVDRSGRRNRIAGLERRKSEEGERSRRASAELGGFRESWGQQVAVLGLSEEATVNQASAALEHLDELLELASDAAGLEHRIAGMKSIRDEFTADSRKLVQKVAPELAAEAPDLAVAELERGFEEAQLAESRRQELQRQMQSSTDDRDEAVRDAAEANQVLGRLVADAGCKGIEELPEIEQQVTRQHELTEEIAGLEARICELGAAPLAELENAAEGIGVEHAEGELGRLDEEIKELRERFAESQREIGAAERDMERLDGSDAAALAADRAQQELARARAAAEGYLPKRLGTIVLQRAIERYRKAHEGPLLARANELFPRLTEGSFEELRVEFDSDDEPILVGRRPNGQAVPIEGMSEGTREQLYLALRLAAIERHIELNGPMPVILDDVVLHSDDERTEAIFAALAELAEKTQVLFFTHKRTLVAAAQRIVPVDRLRLHTLDEEASTAVDLKVEEGAGQQADARKAA